MSWVGSESERSVPYIRKTYPIGLEEKFCDTAVVVGSKKSASGKGVFFTSAALLQCNASSEVINAQLSDEWQPQNKERYAAKYLGGACRFVVRLRDLDPDSMRAVLENFSRIKPPPCPVPTTLPELLKAHKMADFCGMKEYAEACKKALQPYLRVPGKEICAVLIEACLCESPFFHDVMQVCLRDIPRSFGYDASTRVYETASILAGYPAIMKNVLAHLRGTCVARYGEHVHAAALLADVLKSCRDSAPVELVTHFPFEKVTQEESERVMDVLGPFLPEDQHAALRAWLKLRVGERKISSLLSGVKERFLGGFPLYKSGIYREIPAGTCQIGSPDDEPGRFPNEFRAFYEIDQPFAMKETMVTQQEWDVFVCETPGAVNPSRFRSKRETGWKKTFEHPVEGVNWCSAVAYCNWLSGQEGLPPYYDIRNQKGYPGEPEYHCDVAINPLGKKGYHLPLEYTWEYAARVGGLGVAGERTLADVAWFNEDGRRIEEVALRCPTHPVGLKMPNAYGLYDMLGNSNEWCGDTEDVWARVPEGSMAGAGTSVGMYRVWRGGCSAYPKEHVRVARRESRTDQVGLRGTRLTGFRPMRFLEE